MTFSRIVYLLRGDFKVHEREEFLLQVFLFHEIQFIVEHFNDVVDLNAFSVQFFPENHGEIIFVVENFGTVDFVLNEIGT